jgi:threonine synthase
MKTTAAFQGLRCADCGTTHGATADQGCPDCGSAVEATYDHETQTAEHIFPHPAAGKDAESTTAATATAGQWRFDGLLPFDHEAAISAGEGATPLLVAERLAGELGVETVGIKDEGRNPTGSVYDRGMSLAVTAISERGGSDDIEPVALATTGNSGQSAAAYLSRLDVRSYAFVPSRSAFSNKAMINVHGGEMRVIGGRYGDAAAAVDDQLAADYYSLQEFTSPYRHEGAKTVAFELVADLGEAPDYLFVPTSTGELVAGIAKGFEELVALGAVETPPTIVAVQPTSCAPIATAVQGGEREPEPWAVPDTIIGELEVADPAGGSQAVAALDRVGGTALTVDDDAILDAAVTVANNEIIEMGAAGGAAPAGAWAYAEEHGFEGDETVVLLNTESGAKTPDILKSHLMGGGR